MSAINFSVSVSGLEKIKGDVSTLATRLKTRLSAEMQFGAEAIASDAKRNAPADQGILRNEIATQKIDALNYEVTSGAAYSAFVEFGTRTQVSVPSELEAYAAQFKGASAGSSLDAKQAIFDWCKRKGIEPSAWYPIFISIMVKGIAPRPFFFPAFFKQREIIKSNVEQAIKDEV